MNRFVFICVCVLFFHTYKVAGQQAQFIAPASADTMINPIKDNIKATANGKLTFNTFCYSCHGIKGTGDGAAAAGLTKTPANFASPTVQSQTDGALFWKIYNGNSPMPACKMLSATQIWELVNYVRTFSKDFKK